MRVWRLEETANNNTYKVDSSIEVAVAFQMADELDGPFVCNSLGDPNAAITHHCATGAHRVVDSEEILARKGTHCEGKNDQFRCLKKMSETCGKKNRVILALRVVKTASYRKVLS